jgi:AcrR family transcriptional regulator
MSRIVKEEEYAGRRNEIIGTAQRLVYTKGYEQISIQDILDELQISKGAFYHYFDSKQDLVEALIDRMGEDAETNIRVLVEGPGLSALQKLNRFFESAAQWKTMQRSLIINTMRTWYTDDNAFIRQKLASIMMKKIPPLLAPIIRQGIQEKVFTVHFPDQAAEIIYGVSLNISDIMTGLLLSPEPDDNTLQRLDMTMAACIDSMERILGAPSGALQFMDPETLQQWLREWFVLPQQVLTD